MHMGVILQAHSVRGESQVQRNTNRDVATDERFVFSVKTFGAM